MKIEDLKSKDNLVHTNSFDNLFEMVNFIKTADPYEDLWDMSSLEYQPSFTGVESFDEAINLCLNGYKINFSNLIEATKELESALPRIDNRRSTRQSVYGFRPNINKFMTGNPNAMYKLVRNDKRHFIKFFYNTNCRGFTSSDAIMNRGIITIALIKFLEKINNRIDLNLFDLSHVNEEYIYITVCLKTPSQLLDTSICNFPMCHPAFVRSLCFAIKERTKVKYSWWDSYGYTCDEDQVKSVLDIDNNRDLLILEPSRIGVSGYDIIDDTVNFIQNTGFNKLLDGGQRLEFDEKQKKFILTR